MKQISNKKYEEFEQYQYEKQNGLILNPNGIRTICAACDYDAEKIGQHFLNILPTLLNKQEKLKSDIKLINWLQQP